MTYSGEDRRKEPRIHFERFGKITDKENQDLKCYIENISIGGAQIFCNRLLVPGSRIILRILDIPVTDLTIPAIVLSSEPMAKKRKQILQIAKNLHVENLAHLQFEQRIDSTVLNTITGAAA